MNPLDDSYSDDELRELLTRVLSMIRAVPQDDPTLSADVQRAITRRRMHIAREDTPGGETER